MCLYPKLILNRKYLPNKKNGGTPPKCPDERLRYVTAACGKCYECRKQKARGWLVRMEEELRHNPNAVFITLTLEDKWYKNIEKKYNIKGDNNVATQAMRLWLERVRKITKKSIKHWCITELGGNDTERIHIHGILWGVGLESLIRETWKYGFIFIGQYVAENTINYITKYMYKKDEKHPTFTGKVLCSAGIGSQYTTRTDAKNNKYKGEDTKETYRCRNGAKINLPIYYRNKIYTEEERELLWIQKLNKGEVYVMGEKININDEMLYKETLKYYQQRCQQIHGDNPKEWEEAKYLNRLEKQRLAVSKMQRLQRNRSSKKEQDLYNWITAKNTYKNKYKKLKEEPIKEFDESEWLSRFTAGPHNTLAEWNGGIQGRTSLGGQTDSFLQ